MFDTRSSRRNFVLLILIVFVALIASLFITDIAFIVLGIALGLFWIGILGWAVLGMAMKWIEEGD